MTALLDGVGVIRGDFLRGRTGGLFFGCWEVLGWGAELWSGFLGGGSRLMGSGSVGLVVVFISSISLAKDCFFCDLVTGAGLTGP